jgi:hypothetical protein
LLYDHLVKYTGTNWSAESEIAARLVSGKVADQTAINALLSHRKKRFLQNSLCQYCYPVRAIFLHLLNQQTMINIIIWFASFLCTHPTYTTGNHGNNSQTEFSGGSTNGFDDTGGETGGTPKPPPPPPPPGG